MRVDFNVPVDAQNAITDDTRIRAALPTLRAILERGGKPVLLTHFGRPKGPGDDTMRVTHIGARLQELLGSPVLKLDESIGPKVEAAIAAAPMGTTVLCENVRFHPGETKGDEALAQAFARLGTAVHLIEMQPRILPIEDESASQAVQLALAADFETHASARRVPAFLPTVTLD